MQLLLSFTPNCPSLTGEGARYEREGFLIGGRGSDHQIIQRVSQGFPGRFGGRTLALGVGTEVRNLGLLSLKLAHITLVQRRSAVERGHVFAEAILLAGNLGDLSVIACGLICEVLNMTTLSDNVG